MTCFFYKMNSFTSQNLPMIDPFQSPTNTQT